MLLCVSRKSLQYAALGTGCTLTAVPRSTLNSTHSLRSTQPSTLRGTVNENQPCGWVIIQMMTSECSAYSSLYSRTQRSSLQLGLRVGGHLPLTTCTQRTQVNTDWFRATDDSTVNIVVVLLLLFAAVVVHTSVSLYACSAVHSALLVGLLRAKMIGCSLNCPISLMNCSVKAPGIAAAPMATVGFKSAQISSRFDMFAWSCAKSALCDVIPPPGRLCVARKRCHGWVDKWISKETEH